MSERCEEFLDADIENWLLTLMLKEIFNKGYWQ